VCRDVGSDADDNTIPPAMHFIRYGLGARCAGILDMSLVHSMESFRRTECCLASQFEICR